MSSNSNTNNNNGSNFSFSSSTYSSSSYSTSSSADPTGHSQRFTERTSSNDRDGTTVHRTWEETGKPTLEQTRHFASDRGLENGTDRSNGTSAGRIQDVTDEEQQKRDREYEERIEDEYAKREGGA